MPSVQVSIPLAVVMLSGNDERPWKSERSLEASCKVEFRHLNTIWARGFLGTERQYSRQGLPKDILAAMHTFVHLLNAGSAMIWVRQLVTWYFFASSW